jgi:hypothetical protein
MKQLALRHAVMILIRLESIYFTDSSECLLHEIDSYEQNKDMQLS